MIEAILFLFVMFGWKDPPEPKPICYGNSVWLLSESSIAPTWKECTDEVCVAYYPKRTYNKSTRNKTGE